MLKKIALLTAVTLSVSACAKTTHFVNPDNGQSLADTNAITENSDYFISGLFQSKTINAQTACGSSSKVVATQTFTSVPNIILGILTFGLYSPQEQTVFCKK